MKIVSCLLLIAGVTGSLATSSSLNYENALSPLSIDQLTQEGEILTATVNNYADQLVGNLDNLVLKEGLDPMDVPDIEIKIAKKILLITYGGILKLSKIKVNDISTIHRYDDAVISYNRTAKTMRVDIPLELKDIKFSSDFKVTILGLLPLPIYGSLDGSMKSVQMVTSIEINYETFKAKVDQYKIIHTGHISVFFHEFIGIDWLIDLLANSVTTIFKGLIIDIVNKVVEGALEAAVNIINTVFEDIMRILEGDSTELSIFPVVKNIGDHLVGTNLNLM